MIQYDGVDGDATTLDHTGLAGVDLTSGDANAGLLLTAFSIDVGTTAEVRLYTDAANYSSTIVPIIQASMPAKEIFVPFSSFTVGSGAGATFSNIGAVELHLNGGDPSPDALAVVADLRSVTPNDATVNLQNSLLADADLVAFAQALTAANVRLFGTAWCPTCTAQKELFEDGAQFLPFIECSDIDRQPNAEAINNNITAYPTWIFGNGSREVGFMTLEAIASRSGVTIPTSVSPFVAPIEDTIVLDGSPLHVALDGYDPNGGPLTYTVTSSNASIVTATVLTGNRTAAIDFAGWGEIVVQLFEQRASRATSQFIALAESGFYDAANNDPDMTVHRVKDDFMMQFGDPIGTGSGGSTLGHFDDQFHPDLQHNRPGIISYAKSNDDTNDSQVFITDAATRHLDFNHSVFGLVTEGDAVRDAITAVKTNADTWQPQFAVNIQSVSIFDDTENGVVMLKSAAGATGSATITVTVSDAQGHNYTERFDVTIQADTWNGGPYLEDIGPITTTSDQPAVFQLSAIDVEGDAVTFGGVKSGNVNYTLSVDSTTGEVSVMPPTGYIGEMSVTLYVRPATTSDTGDVYDVQEVSILVTPAAPQSVDLVSGSDSGASDSDNVTNATTLQFLIEGVTDRAQVRLHQGNTIIGSATASGTSVTITTSSLAAAGDGTYSVYATQVVGGEESPSCASLDVTIDTAAPAAFTSTPPTTGSINVPISYDAQSPDEGTTGTTYWLQGAPAGATIDPDTGVFTWTPGIADVGLHDFFIVLTDLAGNERTQAISLNILSDAVVEFRLEVTDTSGTPITSIMVGEQFDLRVYVADIAAQPYGVFSAFLDVLYDQQLVTMDGTVTFGSDYPNGHNSNLSTPGLVDETGGFAGTTDLGGGEFLLFSVPLQAVATGTALFESDAADQLPLHEILRYGPVLDVEADEVLYGNTSLTIDPAFNAVDDTFSVDEDSSATTLTVLSNEQIFQGSTGNLTVVDVSSPSQGGIVTIPANGLSVLYTPAADFFGVDTFTYTVTDGTGTDTATVTVQVTPVNDPPTANDDAFMVPENTVDSVFRVRDNDTTAPDSGETLTIVSVSSPSAGGSLSIAPGGYWLLYTPATNYIGAETFTYTIRDDGGATAQATVTVTVVEESVVAEVLVQPTTGQTTETGGTASFQIVLSSQPLAEVTIQLSSSDLSEGVVSPSSVTFTPGNWDAPRTVTVTGQDDTVADGDVAYVIITSPAISIDPDYSDLPVANVSMTNLDDDAALSLSSSAFMAGIRLDVSGVTPGGLVTFVWGTQLGSAYLSAHGITVGIANPTVVAQGIADGTGNAVALVDALPGAATATVYFQAFEQAPQLQLSNVISSARPLQAEGGAGAGGAAVSDDEIPAVFAAAIERWKAAGLLAEQAAHLQSTAVRIEDLPDGVLAYAVDHTVVLDINAAGHGWFVDASPWDDSEFDQDLRGGAALVASCGPAAEQIDLLTVIMHELGHVLGAPDDLDGHSPSPLMAPTLSTGMRALPLNQTNVLNPLDVNGDQYVSAVDALFIIAALNAPDRWSSSDNSASDRAPHLFLDTNHDFYVSPLDALLVIRALNQGSSQDAEGESLDAAFVATDGEESRQLARAANGSLLPAPPVPCVRRRTATKNRSLLPNGIRSNVTCRNQATLLLWTDFDCRRRMITSPGRKASSLRRWKIIWTLSSPGGTSCCEFPTMACRH